MVFVSSVNLTEKAFSNCVVSDGTIVVRKASKLESVRSMRRSCV